MSPPAPRRNLIVNIERMRRGIDELEGEGWHVAEAGRRSSGAFAPGTDIYYCESRPEGGGAARPIAVVVVDLAGVAPDAVSLEVSGRVLVISGSRPVRETEGRAYQQVEIPTGSFRRRVELGVDVDATAARATCTDGLLHIELPFEINERAPRSVPVHRAPR